MSEAPKPPQASPLPEGTNLLLSKLLFASLLVSLYLVYQLWSVARPAPRWDANDIAAVKEGNLNVAVLQSGAKQRELLDRVKREKGTEAVVIDLLSLDLSGLTLEEADLITLSSLRSLRRLNLSRSNVKDQHLEHVALLRALEILDLSGTAVTDTGMRHVKKLKHLRQLELEGTQVTAACVRGLHAELSGVRARLYGPGASVADHCVHASLGKFVLVKHGLERVAFQFTGLTRRGDGGARYVWYRQPNPKARFTQPPVERGEEEVFEKYRRVNKGDGHNWVENDGGDLHLRMGPVRLEWSQSVALA